MSNDPIAPSREARLAERYETMLAGQITVEVRGGMFRRARRVVLDVPVVDLSVTGVSVTVPVDRTTETLSRGRMLELAIDGHSGIVGIRQIRSYEGRLLLGLEFLDLSEPLRELVSATVAVIRDSGGHLSSFWNGAR